MTIFTLSSACTLVVSRFSNMILSVFRWFRSSSPSKPLPSEPASATHPQPDADQSHALRLWQHARAYGPLLHACTAHGPPGRDGPHGPRDAWNGSWCCRRCRCTGRNECGDPSLHVHATAPDEHATPGWDTAHWNHQPLSFVKGEQLAPQ